MTLVTKMFDFFLIFFSLLVTGIPLALQGFSVMKERNDYRKDPKYKDHPEMKGVRKGDRMLIVSFDVSDKDKGKAS